MIDIERLTKLLQQPRDNPTPPRPGKVCAYPVTAVLVALPAELVADMDWFAQLVYDVVSILCHDEPSSFYFEFMGGLCSEDEDFDQADLTGLPPADIVFGGNGSTIHDLTGDFYMVKWYSEGINGFWLFKLVPQ